MRLLLALLIHNYKYLPFERDGIYASVKNTVRHFQQIDLDKKLIDLKEGNRFKEKFYFNSLVILFM